MIANNTNIHAKKISVYDIILSASIFTNVACLVHFQEQNKRIEELIEKNNLLTDSINKLNQDITKMGQEIIIAQSKSLPVFINTSETTFFNRPLMLLGVLAVSLGATYFLSSALITKGVYVAAPKLSISFAPAIPIEVINCENSVAVSSIGSASVNLSAGVSVISSIS